MTMTTQTILILGGTGKTGRRVAERLTARGHAVRIASRSSAPRFDWDDQATWAACLDGVSAVYITYAPDLAVPTAAAHVRQFAGAAAAAGVSRLVLLSGRGEPQVFPAEQAVRDAGIPWTILRCAFFAQNFSEGALAPPAREIAFPGGTTVEPFIDADDIADVAVEALTDAKHAGQVYELTGPQLLGFAQVAAEIAEASGQPMAYVPLSFEAYAGILAQFMPPEHVAFFIELFKWLMDGHNAHVTRDVQYVLGRPARDFRGFARAAAAAGAWQ